MKNDKNVIKIVFIDHHGDDEINIDIKETSYGALRLLAKDLNRLAYINECKKQNNPVIDAYYDLLCKLSNALEKELNK